MSLSSYFSSDKDFDRLYPESIRHYSSRHWTPLQVTQHVVRLFPYKTGARILDIGSGTGKFCLAASFYRPDLFFIGVEQRASLTGYAEAARKIVGPGNVQFIHANFTQVNLAGYDHFYYYNSFFENLNTMGQIDDSIAYSKELFIYYAHYLRVQLDQKPRGTRLVTYHCSEEEIPGSYEEIASDMGRLLKCWEKK